MVSVRCMVPGARAGKSITQNREPFGGGAVPRMRAPISSMFSPMAMSIGIWSLHQISVDLPPPGRRDGLALVATSSISTLATPFASWPVITRRIGGKLVSGMMHLLGFVVPAKAGTQGHILGASLDSRLRGKDGKNVCCEIHSPRAM